MRPTATVLSLLLLAAPASAAVLTFDGNICSASSCSNYETIDQSYGDIAGEVDVIYDADRSAAGNSDLQFWDTGYETLVNLAFGTNGGGGLSIVFSAAAGFDVVLSGFDIAPYADRARNTLVQVIDLATNTLLIDSVFAPLDTSGPTNFAFNYESSTGFQINLGPDAWDVGIDNIAYRTKVSTTTGPDPDVVPLPATALLLGGALLGLTGLRRRKAA